MYRYDRVSVLLAALFFLVVGTFWLLGSLQEPIFYHLVGIEYHALVNAVSFVCIIPMIFGYMACLGRMHVEKVFILVTALYTAFFALATVLLTVPGIGLVGTAPSVYNFLGWATFAIIKSYGSIMVTLFWTYATGCVSIERAKYVFPFITTIAQIGSFGGATLARAGKMIGTPLLMGIAVGGMLLMLCVLGLLSRFNVLRHVQPPQATGVFEGVRLIWRHCYLHGVLVISVAYLIITSFLDYQIHYLAHRAYPSIDALVAFKGLYGQWVNATTFLLSLVGTGWVLRHCGVAWCLLLYPLLTAVCVVLLWCSPTLWTVFGVVVCMKALAMGLNDPTKNIVYIPESEEVRAKVKGWIDIIGYRATFAAGSYLTGWISCSYDFFVSASAIISLLVVGVWAHYARIVGRHFLKTSERKI